MSASYFRTLIGYNRWAWSRVLDRVAELTADEYSSRRFNFGSVRSTLGHISGTEAAYLARLMGKPSPAPRTEDDFPTFEVLRRRWEQQFAEQKAFADSLTDEMVGQSFSYIAGNGRETTWRRDLFLGQLLNHSTQHRAETAMAITEFGHSPGDLDVSLYVRENGPTP
ncbi:MAG TPA: DinB family protein [Dehalococcoidia bacterium]|nr:DinB family protein [Dehalococcoidia bacterium]